LQKCHFETDQFLSPLVEWGGDRKRLDAELDELKGLGVNMLRIMASSEGEGNEPYRMKPCLMTKPGVYNEEIFRGLDYFLDALAKRGFTAIGMCLWGRLKRKTGKSCLQPVSNFRSPFFSDIDQSVALEWRVSSVK
jgi:hypothetical protein